MQIAMFTQQQKMFMDAKARTIKVFVRIEVRNTQNST